MLGVVLLGGITVLFVTGLLSYAAYNPDLAPVNDKTPDKGILGFYIVSQGGGVPYRLKIRSPSFCNLSILQKICPGNLVSDVVTLLGSLDFVMGECDR